jgi:prevent-host-death family protein
MRQTATVSLIMPAITMRKLSRDTADVLDRLKESREPVLITRKGQPVAALSVVDAERAENLILATAPRFKEAMAHADEAASMGQAKTFDEIFPTKSQSDRAEPQAGPAESLAGGAGEPQESRDLATAAESATAGLSGPIAGLDPAAFWGVTRAVVAHMPLAPASTEAASITSEQAQRINDLALSYAEAIVAENIEQMRRAIREVGARIIDASIVGTGVELDRYEQMLERVTAAGQLSAHLHKP